MAQNLTNIGQGGALAQHLARQCMPELMRTLPRRIDAGPRESVPDDRQPAIELWKPRIGAFARKNTNRLVLAGRPTRR